MTRLHSTLVLCASLLLTSCVGTRKLADPILQLSTPGGTELGVSTDYGVLFLGRTARSGPVEITAWFGDGPSIEPSVIEPLGAGLYTAETEIRLPSVPISFRDPEPGDTVVLRGRDKDGLWHKRVTIRSDPRVLGLLIDPPSVLRGREDQVGTGVFLPKKDAFDSLVLVGLVSGRVELRTQEGTREYLTIVGPRQIWRLVTSFRGGDREKRWIYRDDIM